MNKEKKIKEIIDEFIEKGADLEHDRWAGWQAYLFSKSKWTKNGYLIPKELCERWQRQIDTPYEKLSEQEKESDRKEVRKYIPLLEKVFSQIRQETIDSIVEILEKLKKEVALEIPSKDMTKNEVEAYRQGAKDYLVVLKEKIKSLTKNP